MVHFVTICDCMQTLTHVAHVPILYIFMPCNKTFTHSLTILISQNHRYIPVINWTANGGELIWKLIMELEKPENAKVFLRKKNKNDVHAPVVMKFDSILNNCRIQVVI